MNQLWVVQMHHNGFEANSSVERIQNLPTRVQGIRYLHLIVNIPIDTALCKEIQAFSC
jgi:hypothetical protein